MEKVTFIIDGGFFTKKYKGNYNKLPSADDVENYILKIFKHLNQYHNYPIEIYRIFYYDCPPLHNVAKLTHKPSSMKESDFQKICKTLKINIKL